MLMLRALRALRFFFFPLPLVLIFGMTATTQSMRLRGLPVTEIVAADSLWVVLPAVWLYLLVTMIRRKVTADKRAERPI